jgi:hypothetical protein
MAVPGALASWALDSALAVWLLPGRLASWAVDSAARSAVQKLSGLIAPPHQEGARP